MFKYVIIIEEGDGDGKKRKKEAIQYYKKVADHGYSHLQVKHKALKNDMN